MDLGQKLRVIVVACFIVFILFLYGYLIFLYFRYRFTSFMKSKSHRLFFISIIANLIGVLSVLLMTVVSTITEKEDHAMTGFILSDMIFIPIMYTAYIFRVAQMTNVISVKGLSSTKWFLQKTYLLILLIIGVAVLIMGIVIICLVLKKNKLTTDYSDVISIIMASNFFANYLWLIYGINLIRRKGPIKELKQEVIALAIVWVTLNAVFHALIMKSENFFGCTWVIVGRNVITVFISFILPMVKEQHKKFIPYGETRKCVNNVELTLTTKSSFLVFLNYIKSTEGNKGRNAIMLYAQIKRFEDVSANRENRELAIDLATSIECDYLTDQAEFEVEGIPKEVTDHISAKLQNLKVHLNSHLFDSLYGVVLNILKNYFEKFKKSHTWNLLLIELRNNEIIYERMIKSDLL